MRNINEIIKEIYDKRKEYEELISYDYADVLKDVDSLTAPQSLDMFRSYVGRLKTIMLKDAQRYALGILCPANDEGKRKKQDKKKVTASDEYAKYAGEYLNCRPEYMMLENASSPLDLDEAHRKEFHNLYIKKMRKRELDGLIWNCEYLTTQAAKALDVGKILEENLRPMQELLRLKIEDYFLAIKRNEFAAYMSKGGKGTPRIKVRLKVDDDSFEAFADSFTGRRGFLDENVAFEEAATSLDCIVFAVDYISANDSRVKGIIDAFGPLDQYGSFNDALIQEALGQEKVYEGLRKVIRSFDREKIFNLLCRNENYAWIVAKRYQENERRRRLKMGLLDVIPETYPELYPLARQIKRHFILHIGPTNSGKSYDAINALKEAEHGIYLAPLRLLAYEKYEEFTQMGIPCSMITGEEEIKTEDSRIQSSTIEILDFVTEYDVAVIDEGQMLADPQRGSGWTMAILGIRCPQVHICLADEAEEVVKGIIEICGDTYEIVRHNRLVPLVYKKENGDIFPKNAQRGDAFIVFSRRDVHACAAELAEQGIKASMIYGNLPYDVRRKEVKRYESGETDVIVATDAIGMGLNLPIQRIVFLRAEKFDGVSKRELLPQEVKQIAGRAGRFGMYDVGYVSSDIKKRMINGMLYSPPNMITDAVIGFPYSLIDVQGSLSFLLKEWSSMVPLPGFEMADMEEEIKLASELEEYSDDKDLIFRFVMIPFDSDNDRLHKLWLHLFMCRRDRKEADIFGLLPDCFGKELEELETDFKVCDILYHYARDFLDNGEDHEILIRKNEISAMIMEILKKEAPEHRSCRCCGKKLPFKYEYNICEKCFRKGRHRRLSW